MFTLDDRKALFKKMSNAYLAIQQEYIDAGVDAEVAVPEMLACVFAFGAMLSRVANLSMTTTTNIALQAIADEFKDD